MPSKPALFVIVDRDAHGVGLARSHCTKPEADRLRDALARTYPGHAYSVEPMRTKRGRVIYPEA